MTIPLRVLDKNSFRTEEHANCSECELKAQCAQGQHAYAYVPEHFNGIMIVGEGPGHNEVMKKRPFVGRSGQLLRALLNTVGIDIDQCFLTNATLCKPKYTADDDRDGGFLKWFPHAITGCLPRLRAEIEAVRPEVILTLGTPALAALTGYTKTKLKREPWKTDKRPEGCPTCLEARKVHHVVECSAKKPSGDKCGFATFWEDAGPPFEAEGIMQLPNDIKAREPSEVELEALRSTLCPGCSSKRKKCSPKDVKCPTCKGLKTYITEEHSHHHDYTVKKIAGAVFMADKLEGGLADYGVHCVIPTYHPSFLLRPPPEDGKAMAGQFAANAVVRHFEQAKKILLGADLAYERVVKKLTTNADDIYNYVMGPEDAQDWSAERVFELDTETESWQWNADLKGGNGDWEPVPDKGSKDVGGANAWTVTEITCCGIYSPDRGYKLVIDTRSTDRHTATTVCKRELIDALIDCFQESPTPVSMQNGQYDAIVLRRLYGLKIANYADDTLLSHHALAPDEDHNLGHQAHSYAILEPWKPPKRVKGQYHWRDYEELTDYNARDLIHTRLVRDAHGVNLGKSRPGSLLEREGVAQIYEIDMQLQQLAVEMEWIGLPVNEQSIKKVGIQAIKKRDEHRNRLCEMLNEPTFDPTKSAQLQWALYDSNGPLKLTPPARTKTGQGSTEKGHLARMAGEQPFVHELLEFRKHNKICTDFIFGAGFPVREDGRMHPSWRIWGAVTGRWSSSPNFQNLPEWLRAVVEAPAGRCIVGADEDQLELRGIAQLSGDKDLIRRCLESDDKRKLEPDHDLHSYLASLVFGDTYTRLSLKDPNHNADVGEKCRCETCTRKALRTVAKCVDPDTLIWADTLRGGAGELRPISVGVPEEVADGRGGSVRVVHGEAGEVKRMVHVVTRRGILTCGENHLIPLKSGVQVRAVDLPVGAELPAAVHPRLEDAAYPVVLLPAQAANGLPTMQIPLSHDVAYLAGIYLGDGSVSGDSARLHHGGVDKIDANGTPYCEWQQIVVDAARRVGLEPTCESKTVVFGYRHTLRYFAALGLTDYPWFSAREEGSKWKRILRVPRWVLQAGRSAAMHFLAGLFDTDGSAQNGMLSLTTKDAVFAGQVAGLAHSCGLKLSCEAMFNKPYERWYYRVRVWKESSYEFRNYMRHPGKAAQLVEGQCVRSDDSNVVLQVLDAGERPSWDLQVENDDHLYWANGLLHSNTVFYAINYGGGAPTILEGIYRKGDYNGPPITVDLVQRVMRAIFRAFPGIDKFRRQLLADCVKNREVRSPLLRRKREFPLGEVPPTEIYNFPLQSLGADLLALILLDIQRELPLVDPTAFIIAYVHDAVYVECSVAKQREVSGLLTRVMTREIEINGIVMPYTASAKIGTNWKEVS